MNLRNPLYKLFPNVTVGPTTPAAPQLARVQMVALIGFAWSLSIVFRLVGVSTDSIESDLKQFTTENPNIAAALVAAFVLIVGKGASVWKQRHQTSYGMAEVAFGFAFAHQLAVKILGNFNLLGLLGAMSTIYVIARGFNNIAGFNSSRILESGLTARSCRTADASTEISPRS